MAVRLGLGLIPGAGWRASEIQDVARAAEDAGFDAVFCTEVNNDAIGTAQLMGLATQRIRVGTWVANTYLRLPYLCAKAAILAGDATGGRMILGLGVSHQPVNMALGIEMPDPAGTLAAMPPRLSPGCVAKGPQPTFRSSPRPFPVPVYLAALTSQNVELAGEIAERCDASMVVELSACAQSRAVD